MNYYPYNSILGVYSKYFLFNHFKSNRMTCILHNNMFLVKGSSRHDKADKAILFP